MYSLSSPIWQMTSRKMGVLSDDGEFSYSTNYHFAQTNQWEKVKHKNLNFTFLYLCEVRARLKTQ